MAQFVEGLPRELGSDRLVIGSDERQAFVRISGAEGVHAVVRHRRTGFEDGHWWIENNAASGTWLNGERLDGAAQLADGDCISIAGQDILFSNGWLREDHRRAKGVRVDVRGLSDARGGREILRSVSFIANEGEFIGILGPSGCGKSSVIQRIAGLARWASGDITVNGHSVLDDNRVLRRLIAYLPQNVEDSLHDGLTPCEEMACARRIFLAPGEDDESLDAAALTTLGLADVAWTPVGKLSGGQKRRVAIALALLRQPQLLLLDEPTAGLDPATETDVMARLRRLSRQGRTVICATHVMENISLFDKVLVLAGGRDNNGAPVYFGSPDGILARFGVTSYPALYVKLADGTCRVDFRPDGAEAPEAWELPEPPPAASFGRTVSGYLGRSAAELRAAILRPDSWLGRIVSAPVWSVLVQPVLIALGIKLACAKMFAEEPFIGGVGGVSTVLFCAALSVFWLGLAGNVQGLVRERIPGRCLERLGGVSLLRYGVAKLIAAVCPCLVQVLVFSALLFWLPERGVLKPSVGVLGVLSLVCLMGGLVGMAVSSVARNTTWAVSMVPVIAVLALFFSQPVIAIDMSKPSGHGVAEKIATWMPCYRPQVYMCVLEGQNVLDESKREGEKLILDGPETRAAPFRFFALFAGYAVMAVGVSFFMQRRRECAWDGR